MRRNDTLDIDFDDLELEDDFGMLDSDRDEAPRGCLGKEDMTRIHNDNWSIVTAFNVINEELPGSRMGGPLFVRCAEAFSYLRSQLDFNAIQCVVVAMLVENGKPMSFRQMGRVLGLTRLSMMTYYNEIEELFRKRWLLHRGAQESDGTYDGYCLARGVVSAIRENRPFVPENLECADTQEFVDRMADHIAAGYQDDDLKFSDEKMWLTEMVNTNKDLPICKAALALNDPDSMVLLMLTVADYCNFNGSEEEGIGPRDVQLVYPRDSVSHYRKLIDKMQNGTHLLFKENLIEHKCIDGTAAVNVYVGTSYLKDDLLADFSPVDHSDKRVPKMNGYMSCKDIKAKALYYNKAEGEQVERLENILSQEQLPQVQERLKEKGMRTGVCILMHGAPGTGKTATAYELARKTGRDIIQVQVTDFKDKFVGESEQKLKKIFAKYRACCQNCEVTPILLLNEGDAILSKRTTNIEHSVDQMSNALQNILLEEMESLEGVMIVTTNLTGNLDSAFERRFVFKVKFDKPGKDVKAHIWKSMIDNLDDEGSLELAEMFDVSGGEIENVARKATMEYVVTGKQPDIGMIKTFAKEEKLKSNNRPIVGFTTKQ